MPQPKKLSKRLSTEQLAARKAKKLAVTKDPIPNSYMDYLTKKHAKEAAANA